MTHFAGNIMCVNYIVDNSPIIVIALRIVRERLNVRFMVFYATFNNISVISWRFYDLMKNKF